MASRLALAEVQIERSKVVMESLAGFCHALGQPAQVLLSSIELLKMPGTDPELQKQVLEICYDAAVEIRSLLWGMKKIPKGVADDKEHLFFAIPASGLDQEEAEETIAEEPALE